MILDFHIHANTSSDSKMSIEEIYNKALEKGIKNICITCHHEPSEAKNNEFKQSLTQEKIDLSRKEVERLRKDGKVNIYFGVEMSYTESEEEDIKEFLAKNEFDYVLGSIHYTKGLKLADGKSAEKAKAYNPEEVIEEYFRLLKKAIKTRLFDVIAHIDIYKKIIVADYARYVKEWEEVAELLSENNTGFEINTSYSAKVPGGTYPDLYAIKILAKKNNIITIGSDGHKPEEIGRAILDVEKLLKSLGIVKVYKFEKRKAVQLDI